MVELLPERLCLPFGRHALICVIMLGDHYIEILVNISVEESEERDDKGINHKVRSVEIKVSSGLTILMRRLIMLGLY